MDNTLGDVLETIGGLSLSISTRQMRYHNQAFYDDFSPLCIVSNPCIVETDCQPGVKKTICQKLQLQGVSIVPSDSDQYLSAGLTKNVHPKVIANALIMAGVRFVRVVSFGVKIPLEIFPSLDRYAEACNAHLHGFPSNMWDIGHSRRMDVIPCLATDTN